LSGNVNPLFTLTRWSDSSIRTLFVAGTFANVGILHKRKAPPFGRAFLYLPSPELAIGILLLLAGLLLPTTLLLLTWLLTGGLVLLARILVLIAHSGSPLLNAARDNFARRHWLRGNNSSITFILCRRFVAAATPADHEEPAAKTILYKPFG